MRQESVRGVRVLFVLPNEHLFLVLMNWMALYKSIGTDVFFSQWNLGGEKLFSCTFGKSSHAYNWYVFKRLHSAESVRHVHVKTATGKDNWNEQKIFKNWVMFLKRFLKVEWRKAVNSIFHFVPSTMQIYNLEHECNNKKNKTSEIKKHPASHLNTL